MAGEISPQDVAQLYQRIDIGPFNKPIPLEQLASGEQTPHSLIGALKAFVLKDTKETQLPAALRVLGIHRAVEVGWGGDANALIQLRLLQDGGALVFDRDGIWGVTPFYGYGGLEELHGVRDPKMSTLTGIRLYDGTIEDFAQLVKTGAIPRFQLIMSRGMLSTGEIAFKDITMEEHYDAIGANLRAQRACLEDGGLLIAESQIYQEMMPMGDRQLREVGFERLYYELGSSGWQQLFERAVDDTFPQYRLIVCRAVEPVASGT